MEGIARTHTVSSAEASAQYVKLREDFGGLRRIRIVSMSIYDNTTPFVSYSVGVRAFAGDQTLADHMGASRRGMMLLGPIELECTGLFWQVRYMQEGDSLAYYAMYEVIDR